MSESQLSLGMDLALQTVDLLLEQARKHIERVRRAVPVVRVVKVATDDGAPVVERLVPAHSCTDRCDDASCEITDHELRRAYQRALRHLHHVQLLMGGPLPDQRDDEPSYDELVARYRERNGVAT